MVVLLAVAQISFAQDNRDVHAKNELDSSKSASNSRFFSVNNHADAIHEFQQKLTMEFVSTPIREVLKTIASQGHLDIVFDADKEFMDREVTLRFDETTIADALAMALDGTHYQAAVTRRKEIVLIENEPVPVEEAAEEEPEYGNITGRITDAVTGEPLIGANVILKNTAIGAATDVEGRYRINNLRAESNTLVIRYLGYVTKEVHIEVLADETATLNFRLQPEFLHGDEVVIFSQALAQAQAIREQLASNTIVNVVSESRIRELADDNAAESVGRLPGVSILRSAGEAQNVVIRGLSPRFSNVTVGGTRLASTSQGARNTDLHMISSEMISGIELFKALRPDMDADAIAGTVNFSISGAPEQPRTRLSLIGGYNNHTSNYGNFKGEVMMSRRFFDSRLGVMGTASFQHIDRSSDNLDANYGIMRDAREGEAHPPIEILHLELIDRVQNRDRFGGSLVLDYRFNDNHSIIFSNFGSRLNRDEVRTIRRYNVFVTALTHTHVDQEQRVDVLTSTLRGNHNFGWAELEWRASRSNSVRSDPFNHRLIFRENGAFNDALLNVQDGPEGIQNAALYNFENTFLQNARFTEDHVSEQDLNLQSDLKIPLRLGTAANGYVKLGGEHTHKTRSRTSDQFLRGFRGTSETNLIIQNVPWDNHVRTPDGFYSVLNLKDHNRTKETFQDGTFDFGFLMDRDRAREFRRVMMDDLEFYPRRFQALMDNHSATERISAGYIMSEMMIGPRLMILPGVRYEHEISDYTAKVGSVSPLTDFDPDNDDGTGAIRDTTSSRNMGNWFPMVHARYRFTSWLDVRLAVTRSANRPNFNQVVPTQRINIEGSEVVRGFSNLRPAIATSYDAFISLHGNRLGLLTLGGYLKEIDDLIYMRSVTVMNPADHNLPPYTRGYNLNEPFNNRFGTRVYGIEVEWQTSFLYLPRPLTGLVLNVNFSRIWSETQYHQFLIERRPGQGIVGVDTFRVGRMVNQADHLGNITVGYDYRGLSARVSMLYQGRVLSAVGTQPANDHYTAELMRWDASIRQRLLPGLSLSVNFYNITNEPDRSYFSTGNRFPTDVEYYGWSVDLGIRYDF